jgi:hypothetical protein
VQGVVHSAILRRALRLVARGLDPAQSVCTFSVCGARRSPGRLPLCDLWREGFGMI